MTQAAADGPAVAGAGAVHRALRGGEAYLPVLEALGQLCRGPEAAPVLALLEQQAPLVAPDASPSSALPPGGAAPPGAGATPERMLRECAEAVEALTAERPLVLVLEDLQWSDPATLALVAYPGTAARPGAPAAAGHLSPGGRDRASAPLQAVHQELIMHGQCVDVHLEALPAAGGGGGGGAPAGRRRCPRPWSRRCTGARTGTRCSWCSWWRRCCGRAHSWRRRGAGAAGGLGGVGATVPESLRPLIEQRLDGLPPRSGGGWRRQVWWGETGRWRPWRRGWRRGGAGRSVVCGPGAPGPVCAGGRAGEWPDGTVSESY